LDVYEEEEGVFFQDLSELGIQDDLLARLLTFPNVIITSHQAFLTREALSNIATTTLQNLRDFELGLPLANEVRWAPRQ
jgi:D-lactate dehydrogenase